MPSQDNFLMSFTTTIKQSSIYGTILLTPSKRPHPIREPTPQPPPPSVQELYKWTFSKASIAPCFVKDILEMKEAEGRGKTKGCVSPKPVAHMLKDIDFFWLGRVPCRSVRIVGLVVGVQLYERRIVYSGEPVLQGISPKAKFLSSSLNSVDDGTGVIDCSHRATPTPRTPSKPNKQGKGIGVNQSSVPPPQLIPIAPVGMSIRLTGRLLRKYGTMHIAVDEIGTQFCAGGAERIPLTQLQILRSMQIHQ